MATIKNPAILQSEGAVALQEYLRRLREMPDQEFFQQPLSEIKMTVEKFEVLLATPPEDTYTALQIYMR